VLSTSGWESLENLYNISSYKIVYKAYNYTTEVTKGPTKSNLSSDEKIRVVGYASTWHALEIKNTKTGYKTS